MPFNMNFTIEADTERKIIVEKIYGIWKKETADQYYAEFQESVAPLLKEPWAKLINLCNWKSSYPEIVEVIGGHLKWCKDNGMVLSINIIDNPVTVKQLKRMFSIGGTEEISHIFKSMEEGDRFLRKNGF